MLLGRLRRCSASLATTFSAFLDLITSVARLQLVSDPVVWALAWTIALLVSIILSVRMPRCTALQCMVAALSVWADVTFFSEVPVLGLIGNTSLAVCSLWPSVLCAMLGRMAVRTLLGWMVSIPLTCTRLTISLLRTVSVRFLSEALAF